jgi:uncharacterized membrane protein (UPF0127 family)
MDPSRAENSRAAFSLALLLTLAVVLCCWSTRTHADQDAPLDSFGHSTLEIRGHEGRQWLKIWVAVSEAQQEQGLMHVRSLAADHGMLFPQPQPRIMTMWMKNTLIPLDMLFIDAKGRVVCLREQAEPESLALISCDHPVRAVLEIAGGQATRRHLAIGDTVITPALPAPR